MPGKFRSRPILLTALLSGCAATPPRAPAPETYYFDCDVLPARFSEWNRTITLKSIQVAGTVQLIEPRLDERWWPVANILLLGDNDSSPVGLEVAFDRKTPTEVHLSLSNQSASEEGAEIVSLPWRDAPISFALSLSDSGELRVTAGDKSLSLQLDGFEVRKLALSCSTGQFKFRNVTATTVR
jgi:hypothetical protein